MSGRSLSVYKDRSASRLKFMQIRTILYQYIKILIKHVFLLNFTYELLMSFRNLFKLMYQFLLEQVYMLTVILHY